MKKRILSSVLSAALLTLAVACTQTPPTNQTSKTPSPPPGAAIPAELKPALDAITANDIMQHTKTLSADEYEGRGPGTKGEELTVKYLTEQYQRLGLKPGNPDGTYVQKVPLAGFTATTNASFTVGGKTIDLKFPKTTCASRAASCRSRKLKTPISFSSATAWSRRNTAGTITRAWTSKARPSSC